MKHCQVLMKCCIFAALAMACSVASTVAQQPTSKADDEIIRVTSDLIQVGISVTDKNGAFVQNLKKEDFQLRVDGTPVTAAFFEQVTKRQTSGTKQTSPSVSGSPDQGVPAAGGQRRTIAFVVDDLHLSNESLIRTRGLILRFIDEQMLPDDTVCIVSTSGSIGFLQQFSNDKVMLRAAANRLAAGQITPDDLTPPPMSAYEAQAIDRLDREITEIFVEATIRTQRGMNPSVANSIVTSRARSILKTVSIYTNQTLSILQATTRRASAYSGRKTINFISDGFLLDPGNNDSTQSLNRITDAAARSNTVINSFDASGLDANMPQGVVADIGSRPTGRRNVITPATPGTAFQMQAGNRFERQDGMANVAKNTGGRFVHNTNDLDGNLKTITDEASTYYLLAWEPPAESENLTKLRRIEVIVKDRSELTVRVHGGYLERSKVTETKSARPDPTQQLIDTAMSQAPKRDLQVDLLLRAGNSSKDLSVFANVLVDASTVEFAPANEVANAKLEILVLIFNADGKQERSFRTPLDIAVPIERLMVIDKAPRINCDYTADLKPGLYQVRTAVRDEKTGKVGNASRWIELKATAVTQ